MGMALSTLAERIKVATGVVVPSWKLRRVVDGLGVEVPRFSRARVVPESLVAPIIDRLRVEGWLPSAATGDGQSQIHPRRSSRHLQEVPVA